MPLDPAAATSSSTNSGFPSESCAIRSRSAGAAASPSRIDAISIVRSGGESVQDDAVRREATELRDEVLFGDAVLGPEGGNEQHRDPAQVGGDVAQEVPARGIDPVHVVDDEDEPAAARDVPEQIRDGIEQELLPVLRGCPGQVDGRQRRDQPGELWSDIAGEFADDCVPEGVEQPPEGVAPGRIRHPVDTASTSHQRVGLPGREFLEQAGLPDAGLAAHEDQGPRGGGHAFEGGRQPAPRVVTPNEVRCALATRHDQGLCAETGSKRQYVRARPLSANCQGDQ